VRLGDEDDLPEGVGSEIREPLLSDTERPVDLAALRADDTLVEELAAGRMARIGAPARGTEDELVAMLAAWVADVRPAAAAHPLPGAPASDTASPGAALPGTEHRESAPASVTPLGVPKHRAPSSPYGRRLAVAAALVVLGTSGLAVGASNAQPGEVLWPVSRVFYVERARSVEAAHEVNSGLEQARTALREGRSAEAAQAIAHAAAHLPRVRPAEGHAELARAQQLLLDALGARNSGPGTPAPGTPTSPGARVPDAVVPGGIHSPGEGGRTPDASAYASPETGAASAPQQPAAPGSADHLPPSAPAASDSSGTPADQPSTGGAPSTEAPVSSPSNDTPSSGTPSSGTPSSETPNSETPSGTSDGPNSQQSPGDPPSEPQSQPQEQPPAESSPPPDNAGQSGNPQQSQGAPEPQTQKNPPSEPGASAQNEPSTPNTGGRPEQQQDQSPPAADSQNLQPNEPANQPPANGNPGSPDNSPDSGRSSGSGSASKDGGSSSSNDNTGSSSKDRGSSSNDNSSNSSKDRGSSSNDNSSNSSKDRGSSSGDGGGAAKSLISSVTNLLGSLTKKD
jgi:hypothetical protein